MSSFFLMLSTRRTAGVTNENGKTGKGEWVTQSVGLWAWEPSPYDGGRTANFDAFSPSGAACGSVENVMVEFRFNETSPMHSKPPKSPLSGGLDN